MGLFQYVRGKRLHRWLPSFVRHAASSAPPVEGPRHVLFAFCDHHEPLWNGVAERTGDARVRFWSEGYPKLARDFRDGDGHPPRHSFFFPGEQYRAPWLSALAHLTRAGLGEVELHLHHDGDTATSLRRDLSRYVHLFARHGHFGRERGRVRFAFIHGNWCLANARRDGTFCGVDEEIPLLFEAGCYADFTFPSAPDESQPGIVNRIYWPSGDLRRRRAYERGDRAQVGDARRDRLLMVQGPLALALRPELMPIWVDNAAVTARSPGTARRVRTWIDQSIHVEGRPEWVFVKVHTHGAPEREAASLLGAPGRAMHEALARYNDGERYVLHYVTAREMFNIAMAAMEGRRGDPGLYRDHTVGPPPASLDATSAAAEPS